MPGALADRAEASPGSGTGAVGDPGSRSARGDESAARGLLAASAMLVVVGGIASATGAHRAAGRVWTTACVLGVGCAAAWVIDGLRHGQLGVDVIGILALVGAVVAGEPLAGAVIAAMLATGRVLEGWARGRARRTLSGLVERAPRRARRVRDGTIEVVAADEVVAGDRLVVATGEVIPVDGVVTDGPAVVDESTLTGEPMPVRHGDGDAVRSGTVNAGAPFEMRAACDVAGSTYAQILRLVEEASSSKAAFTRMADRVALGFTVLALSTAAIAWLASGQLVRAVAVLVVATPCPLILAAPVAMVAGLSRAAQRGVVIKGGAALEQLALARTVVFDKTGTLTSGRPTVREVLTTGAADLDDVLRLAASVEQASSHVLGGALVAAAADRGLALLVPTMVEELAGERISGMVDGRLVEVGKARRLGSVHDRWVRSVHRRAASEGSTEVFVLVDGEPVGAILCDDPLRADAPETVRLLRHAGIERIVVLSGDRAGATEAVGAVLGVDAILADRNPGEKLEAVRAEQAVARTIMVGDGINDAPGLAAADVGIAIGARGATASSESADVVLAVDRLDRIADALVIARRTVRLARQSVIAGMGLSLLAMAWAAAGGLAPVGGALLQEGIDAVAILNALRALRSRSLRRSLGPVGSDLARRFLDEHRQLRPRIDDLRQVADRLDALGPDEALDRLRAVARSMTLEVAPHEVAEGAQLYPEIDRVVPGEDPTGPLARVHVEIAHLIRQLATLVDDLGDEGPDAADLVELRQVLYGLHTVMRLHMAQEDERYATLVDGHVLAG